MSSGSASPDWSRYDLHGPAGIVTPTADYYFLQTAVSGGEPSGVLSKEPFRCQRLRAVGGGIQHHLDHAVDTAISAYPRLRIGRFSKAALTAGVEQHRGGWVTIRV